VLLLSTLVVCPRTALAEPTATELAVARRLFDDAVLLEREGRWELAVSKLREAIEVKDTPGLRFHLAHAEEKLGQLVEAMLDYERAEELIRQGAKAPDVQALLGPARSALANRIPTLVIVAPADTQGIEVEIDGKRVARSVLGRPAPVNPATHRVEVRAPGHETFVENVAIQAGERRTVHVELVPTQGAAAQPEPQPKKPLPRVRAEPSRNRRIPTRTYFLVGESVVTLAGLGVGLGSLLVSSAAEERKQRARTTVEATLGPEDGACTRAMNPAQRTACRDLSQAIDDERQAELASTLGFVAAGVGAAAFALTLALWSDTPAAPEVAARFDGTMGWITFRQSF
jgi:hypothetical protein